MVAAHSSYNIPPIPGLAAASRQVEEQQRIADMKKDDPSLGRRIGDSSRKMPLKTRKSTDESRQTVQRKAGLALARRTSGGQGNDSQGNDREGNDGEGNDGAGARRRASSGGSRPRRRLSAPLPPRRQSSADGRRFTAANPTTAWTRP